MPPVATAPGTLEVAAIREDMTALAVRVRSFLRAHPDGRCRCEFCLWLEHHQRDHTEDVRDALTTGMMVLESMEAVIVGVAPMPAADWPHPDGDAAPDAVVGG